MAGTIRALLAAGMFAAGIASAPATDLVRGRQTLPELVLGNEQGDDYAVSQKDFELESGKSYRLDITSNGGKEYKFVAPDLFRYIWINQIVINDLEVQPLGGVSALEFDDKGTITVEFVTIRPGEFSWAISGLESKGMSGKFVVK